jgi:hypothetical protein
MLHCVQGQQIWLSKANAQMGAKFEFGRPNADQRVARQRAKSFSGGDIVKNRVWEVDASSVKNA